MKFRLILLLLSFQLCASAQAPSWVWGKQGIGAAEGIGITSDAGGNVYLCGGYFDTSLIASMTFDTAVLHSHNYGGVFLVKYNSSGNFLWARSSDGIGYAYHAATDVNGNVFVVGLNVDSTLIFGNDTLVSLAGSIDIFLVKYDAAGNELWARGAGGLNQDDGIGVAADPSGNVLITGESYSDTLHFGTTTLVPGGYGDIFTAKYDPSGNLMWARSSQDSSYAVSGGVSTDLAGNIYTAGYFSGHSITFGNITLLNSDPNGYADLFLVKYDPSGNVIWARSDGGINDGEETYSSCFVQTNKIFVTGVFGGAGGWTFGSSILSPATGDGAFFIAEYDTAGNPLWASRSTGATVIGFGVAADTNGNAFVCGGAVQSVPGLVSFDTIQLFVPASSDESFIAEYDSLGAIQWVKLVNAGGDDQNGIAVGTNGDIFFGGDFITSPVIFGPDTLVMYGGESPFVAKLGVNSEIGIPEVELNNSASVFPNPFSSTTTIQLKNELQNGRLSLFDICGNEIETSDGINGSTIRIFRNDLPAGVYFITIESDGTIVAAEKLVITDR